MKKYYPLVFLLLSFGAFAQQDIQHTQFMFNKMQFNPAYAGTKTTFNLSVLYRKQWVGIDRAPQTATFNADGVVFKKRIGLGLTVSYDEVGFTNRVSAETNYSYIIRFKQDYFLSLGIRASVHYTQIRWDQADLIDNFDASIPQSAVSRVLPNFGAGAYFQGRHFYVGFSVPHIFRNQGDFSIKFNGVVEPEFTQHFYFMGGFMFDLVKNVQIQQNFLLKYALNAPPAIDINLSFIFFQKVLVGVTYRIGDSIDAIVQWQITPQIRIALAYDFTITDLQRYNAGSIEAMIGCSFLEKDNSNREIFNERFF